MSPGNFENFFAFSDADRRSKNEESSTVHTGRYYDSREHSVSASSSFFKIIDPHDVHRTFISNAILYRATWEWNILVSWRERRTFKIVETKDIHRKRAFSLLLICYSFCNISMHTGRTVAPTVRDTRVDMMMFRTSTYV